MATPISGKDGKVTYGTGPTTMAITKWSLKNNSNAIDVSNTTDGRRRIAGLPDAEGTVEVHVDTAATYETDLAVGTIVNLALYTLSNKKYTVNYAIIDSIDYSNEVEGTYDATFAWKLAQGTPPVAPA